MWHAQKRRIDVKGNDLILAFNFPLFKGYAAHSNWMMIRVLKMF